MTVPLSRLAVTATAFALTLTACLAPKNKDGDTASGTTAPSTTDSVPGVLQYAPVADWEAYRFDDFPVRQFIPPDPKGLIFVYHGSNGGIGFVNKIETIATLNALILSGIGFVATESDNRQTGQWDTSTASGAANVDLQRMDALYQEVIATTEITASTPIFAMGFSNGGSFSGIFGQYALEQNWPITGIFPHLSGCGTCYGSPVPVAYVEGENDPQSSIDSVISDHRDRGIPAEHFVAPELVLDPLYFTKNPAVSDERSESTFNDLVALELIDADGVRLVPTEEADQWTDWYGNNGTVNSPDLRAEELKVAWGLHRMNAYHAFAVRDFALDQL